MPDVDAFTGKRRAHFVACRIITATSPEGSGAAKPRHRDSRVRRHAAADRRIIKTPDLLAAAGEQPLDAPHLIECGKPEADDADASRTRGQR